MKTNFSLLFYLKKPKNYVKGDVTVIIMKLGLVSPF